MHGAGDKPIAFKNLYDILGLLFAEMDFQVSLGFVLEPEEIFHCDLAPPVFGVYHCFPIASSSPRVFC